MISWIGRGESFAYLEDKIYCAFEEGQQLTLYLKKEEGIRKCEIYVNALEQLMKQKYDEILLVAQYISQGDDVIYRKEVFELTKQTFLKLVNYRTMLKENIQSFEQKFLLQYQSSLSQHLNDYLTKLSTLSKNLEQLPPPTSIT
ncbi:MAG: hypothetical protein LBP53_05890 [Candidatus Peribacteria bacterium]|nr:hypothetical protein [Candidatus Peribacteria bacterium]